MVSKGIIAVTLGGLMLSGCAIQASYPTDIVTRPIYMNDGFKTVMKQEEFQDTGGMNVLGTASVRMADGVWIPCDGDCRKAYTLNKNYHPASTVKKNSTDPLPVERVEREEGGGGGGGGGGD